MRYEYMNLFGISMHKWVWVLGALVFLLYAPTLRYGYNLDDELVVQSHRLKGQGIEALVGLFTRPYFDNARGHQYGYRPMVLTTFAVEEILWGASPNMSHLVNVLLYVCILFGVYRLGYALAPKIPLFGFLSACLFALHPLHTEVVVSIKNRDELLAMLFTLSCFHAYVRHLKAHPLRAIAWAALYGTLALLSKKSALPPLLLLPIAALFVHQAKPKWMWATTALICLWCLIFMVPSSGIGNGYAYYILSITPIALFFGVYSLTRPQALPWGAPYTLLSSASLFAFALGLAMPEHAFFLLVAAISASTAICLKPKHPFAHLLGLSLLIAIAYLYWNTFCWLASLLLSLLCLLKSNKKNPLWVAYGGVFIVAALGYLFHTQLALNQSLQALILCGSAFLFLAKGLQGTRIRSVGASLLLIASLSSAFQYGWTKNPFCVLGFVMAIALLSLQKTPNYSFQLSARTWIRLSCLLALLPIGWHSISQAKHEHAQLPWHGESPKPTLLQREGRQLDPVEHPLVAPHRPAERIATAAYTLFQYARLHLLPYPLSAYYGYAVVQPKQLTQGMVWFAIALYIALALLTAYCLKKSLLLGFALLYYLVGVLPYANLWVLVAGGWAERLVFQASLGFCMAIAYLFTKTLPLSSGKKYAWAVPTLIVLLAAYGGWSFIRSTHWETKEKLYQRDLIHYPQSVKLNQLLGSYYLSSAEGKQPHVRSWHLRQAQHYLRKALRWGPEVGLNWFSLGLSYQRDQRLKAAILCYQRAIFYAPQLSDTYFNIAVCQSRIGQVQSALKNYHIYLDKRPHTAAAYTNLSFLYFQLKEYESAKRIALEATQRFPKSADMHLNLGKIYLATQDTLSALRCFQQGADHLPLAQAAQWNKRIQQLKLRTISKK